MKVRSDFVSNSSSSSFILGNCKLFDHYNVSFSDICDAINSLGGDGFSEHYEAYSLPDDVEKADEKLGPLLQNWNQCIPTGKQLFVGLDEGAGTELFEKFLEALNITYRGAFLYQGTDEELEQSKVPGNLKEVIKEVRTKLCVKTAREVLKNQNAKCVFHFDDNYIWDLEGVNEDDPKWKTESYTIERVFEAILRKLAEMGKIKLDDKEVLSNEYPWCGNSTGTYLQDGRYNAKDFIDESCLHFIGHEG